MPQVSDDSEIEKQYNVQWLRNSCSVTADVLDTVLKRVLQLFFDFSFKCCRGGRGALSKLFKLSFSPSQLTLETGVGDDTLVTLSS